MELAICPEWAPDKQANSVYEQFTVLAAMEILEDKVRVFRWIAIGCSVCTERVLLLYCALACLMLGGSSTVLPFAFFTIFVSFCSPCFGSEVVNSDVDYMYRTVKEVILDASKIYIGYRIFLSIYRAKVGITT